MTGFHIDKESVASVARRTQQIADAMPKGVAKAKAGAAQASAAGNDGTAAASALKQRFQEWSEQYDLLTRQVAGFAADVDGAVKTWTEIEGANAEVFDRYGKDL